MRKNLSRIFIILLISFLSKMMIYHGVNATTYDTSPNILIIHSYDLSYLWTYNQDNGIRSTILSEYPKANIYTEYLDANRFDEGYIFSDMLDLLVNKYSNRDIDIILTTDDAALKFSLELRDRLSIIVPVVFGGVGQGIAEAYIGDNNNVSGTYEIRLFNGMIELMKILQPEATKVVIINDTSVSSRQLVQKVLEGFEDLGLTNQYEISFWEEKAYNQILTDVSQLDNKTALFLISYHKSYDEIIKTGQVFSREISNQSSVPMYSLGEVYFGYGLTGGQFLSGYMHGQVIGDIAIRILLGESAESIPIYNESTSYFGVDENMLRKFNLMNVNLPEGTIIINENLSFYQLYSQLIWTSGTIFFLLVAVIFLLLNQRKIMAKKNKVLILQKEDLDFMSKHDYLTNLYNRRYFVNAFNTYISKGYSSIGLMMIDINGLKLINDAYGYIQGDEAIIRVSNLLLEVFDQEEVARIGGDEFAILLTNKSAEEIQVFKDRLIELSKVIRISNIPVSLAIGYEILNKNDKDIDELLSRAEKQLYRHKITVGESVRNNSINAILSTLTDKYEEEKIHSENVSYLCKQIGTRLGLAKEDIDILGLAGMYHDIGKISLPDAILKKPGKLTDEEFDIIKTHSLVGYQILRAADEYSGLAEYALSHHERWDGRGYPKGLKGNDIPLFSRIIGVVDAFEAMTADRPYRKAMKIEDAVKELQRYSGTQFDPKLVDVLINDVLLKDKSNNFIVIEKLYVTG